MALITITLTPKEAEALRIGIQSSDYHPRHCEDGDNPQITRPLVRAEKKLLAAIREAETVESDKRIQCLGNAERYETPQYPSDVE